MTLARYRPLGGGLPVDYPVAGMIRELSLTSNELAVLGPLVQPVKIWLQSSGHDRPSRRPVTCCE